MNRHITRARLRRLALALGALALGTAAQAQRPASRSGGTTRRSASRLAVVDGRTPGFVLGAYTIAAPGVTVTGADVDDAFKTGLGPGAGIMAGYGFNRTFSLFASADLAKQGSAMSDVAGSFGLAHLEIGARANLPLGDGINVPYITASLGHRGVGAKITQQDETSDLKLTGGMFGVGGGIQHELSSTVALDGGLELGFGRFAHLYDDGDQGPINVNGSTTIRLRFGVMWRPSTRRWS